MPRHLLRIVLLATLFGITSWLAEAQEKPQRPNIVLMFPDNLGWGEVGAYGSVRGVPTPSIDRIADEGIRLDNFNVENSCTISRLSLLTGRYAIRTGGDHLDGVTLWEVTLAEALQSVGYATGLFGKWHLGGADWVGRRGPTNQGFDEWYGIPGTTHTAQFTSFENFDPATMKTPSIWQGRAGDSPIIGAGQYCDNRIGAAGSTGRGEANIKVCGAFLVVESMRQGATPTEACLKALERTLEMTEDRLLDGHGRPLFGLSFYAISNTGRYGSVTMDEPTEREQERGAGQFAVADRNGARLEPMSHLFTADLV